MSESGIERTGLLRRLVEIAARGEHGQLGESEQRAEAKCRYCGESHLGELYQSPPDGYYIRYYCPNTGEKGRRSFL